MGFFSNVFKITPSAGHPFPGLYTLELKIDDAITKDLRVPDSASRHRRDWNESMKGLCYILAILLFLGCKNKDPKVEPLKTSVLTLTVMGYEDSSNKELKPYEGLKVYFFDYYQLEKDDATVGIRSFDIATGAMTLASGRTYPYSQVGVIDKFGKCSMSIPYGEHRVFLTNGIKADSSGTPFYSNFRISATGPNTDKSVELKIH
ncbi:hypothetical protein [Dyadobacter diqingensis]|uniref:hypothetical protein n=1 Tax=Dyadobacter diqingensis TaxID=2938121 RepID=UPI0020C3E27F|nr:hypothetical protein [Dyadobacter diqingensis]